MRKFSLLLMLVMLATTLTSVNAQEGQTYYVKVRAAKIRTEATTTAKVVATLSNSTPVIILEVVKGTKVSNSTTWYKISADGIEGYVHSSLVTDRAPVATRNNTAAPVSPISAGGGCPSTSYTCSKLTCDQAYACLAAGNGKLDKDKDGVPCESICSGG